MLMIRSAADMSSERSGLELCPAAEIPHSASTAIVVPGIYPNGTSPALDGSITSKALCRAIASAIWLRHALPIQRNRTFFREAISVFPSEARCREQNDTDSGESQV